MRPPRETRTHHLWAERGGGLVNRGFNQYAEQTVRPVFTQWSSTLCQGLWLSKRSPNGAETKETDKSCVYRSWDGRDFEHNVLDPPTPPAAPWERKVRISLSTPHESPSSFLSRFHPLIPVCCPNLTAIAQRAGAHAKGKLRPRCQSKHKNPVQSRQSESHMLMSCPLTQPSVFGLPV